ncbi:MAG: hypothetical protein M3R69_05340 [Acidobacteriota bacterium]|nr:hypothetical protein [Acidobacteriota bacterium]
MGDLEVFQVDIRDDERPGREPKLKVVWNYQGRPHPPYFVPEKLLKDRATDVRNALQRLMDKGMNNDGLLVDCEQEVHEVAESGHKLYAALFHPGDGFDAIRIRDWLKKETAGLQERGKQGQISFTVDSLIHIPWGLICDRPPSEFKDHGTEVFDSFWCIKYKLSSVFFRILPEGLNEPEPADLRHVLSVVHKTAFDVATKYLTAPEDEISKWMLGQFGEPLASSTQFYKEWQTKGEGLRLLYFYCHANSSNLALGEDDEITITDFRQETVIPKSTQQSTCVVFLNGCNTAIGESHGAFLEATGELLFCGFIGTETKVPDVFALRFGLSFLYYFLNKGWPVYRIMDHLRKQHWPLAMTYSTYCPPMLRFEAKVDPVKIEMNENFSLMPLGTLQMS